MNSNTVNLTDLKISDIVTICFYPYSQKYLDMLTSRKGTIVAIGSNPFDYMIKTENDTIIHLFHDSISYYEDTLGYDYIIYRN
jgi:hypothetical protein